VTDERSQKRALSLRLKAEAYSLGFTLAGITSADPLLEDAERYGAWIREGRHGQMSYLERDFERRADPGRLLEGARSVLCLGIPHARPSREEPPPGHGRVAAYAWGRDYHNVLRKKLKKLVRIMSQELVPGSVARGFVDSGALLERAFSRRAGLGFIGKNTMLISRRWGSYFMLSAVLWTEALVEDTPAKPGCGSCRLCLDACPTGALDRPYQLDARRCLSYLTIEVRGERPEGSPKTGAGWVFGCDDCQTACPYNQQSWPAVPEAFQPGMGTGAGPSLSLEELGRMEEEEFRQRFEGTPLMRAKHAGMQRNARVLLEEQAEQGETAGDTRVSRDPTDQDA